MPLPPIPVANELLINYGANGDIDPLKLQKLLYFANGWWLALAGEPLLTDRPQVWRYGPVFRWVYNAFARWGNSRIPAPLGPNPLNPADAAATLPEADRARIGPFLNWVWQEYGGKSGVQLSDATHAFGTPWQRIASENQYAVPIGTEISPREDYEYFSGLALQRGWVPVPLNPQFAA